MAQFNCSGKLLEADTDDIKFSFFCRENSVKKMLDSFDVLKQDVVVVAKP